MIENHVRQHMILRAAKPPAQSLVQLVRDVGHVSLGVNSGGNFGDCTYPNPPKNTFRVDSTRMTLNPLSQSPLHLIPCARQNPPSLP